MATTPTLSPTREESPAHAVLHRFLVETLTESSDGFDETPSRAEIDLRTDILYVLTDEKAHRRALPFRRLVKEVGKLQMPELMASRPTAADIEASLRLLVGRRLVREFAPSSVTEDKQYELAHDFLVRFVVRCYRELERRRIAELAVLKQRREVADAELNQLSKMRRSLSAVLCILPVLTFVATVYLVSLSLDGKLLDGVGLSYLWFIVCPAAAMLLMGAVARRWSTVLLAGLLLILCWGTWRYEFTLESIDVGTIYRFDLAKPDFCTSFSLRFEQDFERYTPFTTLNAFIRSCHSSQSSENFSNMRFNAEHPRWGGNFCWDVSQVFGNAAPTRYMVHACSTNLESWRSFVADFNDYRSEYTGFTLRPYQLNRLSNAIAMYAILVSIANVLLYPAIILGMLRTKSEVTVGAARILAEIYEVIFATALTFSMLLMVARLWFGRFSAGEDLDVLLHIPRKLFSDELSLRGLGILALCFVLSLILYVALSVTLLRKTGILISGVLTGIKVINVKASSIWRLIWRQVIVFAWGVINLFLWGLPSIIVTSLYVWLRPNHQLFCDDLLNLRTGPREILQQGNLAAGSSASVIKQAKSSVTAAAG